MTEIRPSLLSRELIQKIQTAITLILKELDHLSYTNKAFRLLYLIRGRLTRDNQDQILLTAEGVAASLNPLEFGSVENLCRATSFESVQVVKSVYLSNENKMFTCPREDCERYAKSIRRLRGSS